MDDSPLETLKEQISKLPPDAQDQLAGYLLMQRLKRNQLVMPHLHQRVDDADPDNWQTLEKTRQQIAE